MLGYSRQVCLGKGRTSGATSDKPSLRSWVSLYVRLEVFKLVFVSAMIHIIGTKANNNISCVVGGNGGWLFVVW